MLRTNLSSSQEKVVCIALKQSLTQAQDASGVNINRDLHEHSLSGDN